MQHLLNDWNSLKPAMTIAVPELILDEFLDIEEACQHRKHGIENHLHDDGPATYWFEFLCPNCGGVTRGYRCERWSRMVMTTFANIQCNEHCGANVEPHGCVHFTRLSGAA